MQVLVIGLNHQTAPVAIREQFAFQESDLKQAMISLKDEPSILENIIISTCNRTEIYTVVDHIRRGEDYIKRFLATWFQLPIDEFASYLTIYENEQAIKHLFRVTCGLDSLVIGETQILGQVRSSFLLAQENHTTGTLFNTLFKQVITLAKRAHTETEIGNNAVSVSYAAIQLAKNKMRTFEHSHVVIIGAGKMGELAAKHITSQKIKHVTIVNRTLEKAEELAEKYHGTAVAMEQLEEVLVNADIVISSTGARECIVTEEMMMRVKEQRKNSTLFMADIAVPRDIDANIKGIQDILLYDIDDLKGIIEGNLEEREEAARKIEAMIEQSYEEFIGWLDSLEAVPIITALREKSMNIQAEVMGSIERKLPSLSERERKIISKLTKSIVNQMLRDPIMKVKEMATDPMADMKLQIFKETFSLEDIEDAKKKYAVTSE